MVEKRDSVSTFPEPLDRQLVELLRRRVADVERTQREEDVEGFMDLFDDDAVWVSRTGLRLLGKEQISEFTRQTLPGAFETGSVHYVLRHVSVIEEDVVLTALEQVYVDDTGQPLRDGAHGRPSYVWRRTGSNAWLIVVGQNTQVAS